MTNKIIFLLVGFSISFNSFSQSVEEKELNKEITNVLNEYYAAVNAQDVNKTISYCLNSPDFITYVNGRANNYEEWTNQVKAFLPTPKKIRYSFDTLYTRKISDDAVYVTGPFHQDMTDKDNKASLADITASMVLLKKNGEWKIAYATSVYLLKAMEK